MKATVTGRAFRAEGTGDLIKRVHGIVEHQGATHRGRRLNYRVDGVCQCGCSDEDTRAHINYFPGGHDKDCRSLSITEAPEGLRLYLGRLAENGLQGTETAVMSPGDTGSWVSRYG